MSTAVALLVALSAAFGLGWMTGGAWYRNALRRALHRQRAARTVPPITGEKLRHLLETIDAERRA